MTDSIDPLLSRYRELAAVHAGVDYAHRASVRRGNAAADEMRRVASRIAALGHGAVEAFAGLLADGGPMALWAAHHLLELMDPSARARAAAVSVIEARAGAGDAIALGERRWLEEYHGR